jgi:hypothetical protein
MTDIRAELEAIKPEVDQKGEAISRLGWAALLVMSTSRPI